MIEGPRRLLSNECAVINETQRKEQAAKRGRKSHKAEAFLLTLRQIQVTHPVVSESMRVCVCV